MEKSQGGMHRFDRMRLWGLSGARDEFHFDAIVQNLKTTSPSGLGPCACAARTVVLGISILDGY